MRKFIDKYLFSRVSLQALIAIAAIMLLSVCASVGHKIVTDQPMKSYAQSLWGFKHLFDTGTVAGTISDSDEIEKESGGSYRGIALLMVALVSWFSGMVVYSFLTGIIVNKFDIHKDDIENGRLRYKFKDHGVIVGWDFQGVATVLAMLESYGLREVLIISDQESAGIRNELSAELDAGKMRRVFIYNGSVGVIDDLQAICAEKSKVIVVLGDQNDVNNDGGNMAIAERIASHVRAVLARNGTSRKDDRIRLYVDVSNVLNLPVARAAGGIGCNENFFVRIINFYEASVYELFASVASVKSNLANGFDYVPLFFRSNSEANHVHLVVSGFDGMAQALVRCTIPLLGLGDAVDYVSVFGWSEDEVRKFKNAYDVDRLEKIKVNFYHCGISSAEAEELLGRSSEDLSSCVTLCLCGSSQDEVMESFSCLPKSLRNRKIRVLLEQRMLSKWAWDPVAYESCGYWDVGFFGFIDKYLSACVYQERLHRESFSKTDGHDNHDKLYFCERPEDWSFMEILARLGYRIEPAGQGSFGVPDAVVDSYLAMQGRGLANELRLAGFTPSSSRMKPFLQSDEICEYRSLPDAKRKLRKSVALNQFGFITQYLAGGEGGFVISKNRVRKVIGLAPVGRSDEDYKITFAVCDDYLQPLFYNDRKSIVPAAVYGNGKALSRKDLAFMADPSDPVSFIFLVYGMLSGFGAKPILVMSGAMKKFADPAMQVRYDCLVRNAHAIIILPPGSDVGSFVRSHSDSLIYEGQIPSAGSSEPEIAGVPSRRCVEFGNLRAEGGQWKVVSVKTKEG